MQKQAVEQTKAVFPALNQKIRDALTKLEEQLVRLTTIFPLVATMNGSLTHNLGARQGLCFVRRSHQGKGSSRCWSHRCKGVIFVNQARVGIHSHDTNRDDSQIMFFMTAVYSYT